MNRLAASLGKGRWGLARSRETARQIEHNARDVRALVAALFSEEGEIRKRAADVARRITEADAKPLQPYAEELAGLLAVVPVEEARMRWHLGLVVARIAHTREQHLRVARLIELLMEEESNVARCSAVEGIGVLACSEPSLRGIAEEMIERAFRDGTPAMKCRAREARRKLEKTAFQDLRPK